MCRAAEKHVSGIRPSDCKSGYGVIVVPRVATALLSFRVVAHLENLEILQKSGNSFYLEKSGKNQKI